MSGKHEVLLIMFGEKGFYLSHCLRVSHWVYMGCGHVDHMLELEEGNTSRYTSYLLLGLAC